MYYVFDVYGDGYTTISKNLPEDNDYKVIIGEYSSEKEALEEATRYEDYIQEQIDKSVENWYYDDYDDYDDEDEEE